MSAARALKIGFSVFAMCGALAAWSLPAHAGESTGTWRNGMVSGPAGVGYYGSNGGYYVERHRSGRRGYAREYRRPSRGYYVYEDPYAIPRRYGSRGYGYGYSREQYLLEKRDREYRAYDAHRSR